MGLLDDPWMELAKSLRFLIVVLIKLEVTVHVSR